MKIRHIQINKPKIGVFLCAIIVILVGYVFFIRWTRINTIQVVGMNADIEIDESKIPKSLIFFPVEQVENILEREYPLVEKAQIEKKFPSTLIVHLTQRPAIAVIKNNTQTFFISKDGIVLEPAGESKLPIIFLDGISLKLGNTVDEPAVRVSLAFLSEISQDEGIGKVDIVKETGVIRIAASTYTILLSKDKDGIGSARALQSVLSGFKIKGQIPKQIDLRFDQPVVNW